MSPRFTTLALAETMLRMTRLAMTVRELAGPQESPLMLQSLLSLQMVWPMRHMREAVAVAGALQRSPSAPARQRLMVTPVQGLALGTQVFRSSHLLSV